VPFGSILHALLSCYTLTQTANLFGSMDGSHEVNSENPPILMLTPSGFFLKEPPSKGRHKEEVWQLEENNICCLTADSYTKISLRDKERERMRIITSSHVCYR
jgi:hypothetical protein